MRLSRPRVLLRALLLAVGAAFLGWKAWAALAASRAATGPEAVLLSRVALVEAAMAVLALATAAVALLALRPRRRSHTLRLSDLPPRGRDPQ